jgi:hypothetical protein
VFRSSVESDSPRWGPKKGSPARELAARLCHPAGPFRMRFRQPAARAPGSRLDQLAGRRCGHGCARAWQLLAEFFLPLLTQSRLQLQGSRETDAATSSRHQLGLRPLGVPCASTAIERGDRYAITSPPTRLTRRWLKSLGREFTAGATDRVRLTRVREVRLRSDLLDRRSDLLGT